MLGALLMQSLQSGMMLLELRFAAAKTSSSASVLVVAVWLDTIYRRRVK